MRTAHTRHAWAQALSWPQRAVSWLRRCWDCSPPFPAEVALSTATEQARFPCVRGRCDPVGPLQWCQIAIDMPALSCRLEQPARVRGVAVPAACGGHYDRQHSGTQQKAPAPAIRDPGVARSALDQRATSGTKRD